MQRRLRNAATTAAALTLVLVGSGCSSKNGVTYKKPAAAAPASDTVSSPAVSSTAGTSTAGTSTAGTSAPVATAAAGAGGKLAVAKNGKLGDIVVDAQGFTLYRFDNDTNTPPKSTCTGGCQGTWPPALSAGPPAATGIDAALLGTLKTADGGEQITLGGWPLYRFAPDKKPGDAGGQGVGGIWWALTPAGAKAAATP